MGVFSRGCVSAFTGAELIFFVRVTVACVVSSFAFGTIGDVDEAVEERDDSSAWSAALGDEDDSASMSSSSSSSWTSPSRSSFSKSFSFTWSKGVQVY